jgi:anti-anti-sigma regulatory factor
MSSFIKNTKEVNQIVIIETDGYLNKEGGEAIAAICYEKIKAGQVNFLINMATTKVVNSIGVSILIEIIESISNDRIKKLITHCCLNRNFDFRNIKDYLMSQEAGQKYKIGINYKKV